MSEKSKMFIDARLFSDGKLDFTGGRRQMFIRYEKEDSYILNHEYGLASLEMCVLEYLHSLEEKNKKKYDLIIYLDRNSGNTNIVWEMPYCDWLADMKTVFEKGCNAKSRSPNRKGENRRNANLDDADLEASPTQDESGSEEKFQPSVTGGEENILGSVDEAMNRVVSENGKVAIVFHSPDTLYNDPNPNPQTLDTKMQYIADWSKKTGCDSFLIISRAKCSEDFLESLYNKKREKNAQELNIEAAGRQVFRDCINRILCLNLGRIECGDPETISITAESRQIPLKGFVAEVRAGYERHVQKNTDSAPYNLDELYLEDAKVKNREKVLEDIEGLVGLDDIKKYAHDMVTLVENLEQARKNKKSHSGNQINVEHLMFVGNPGTGKTEVARLVGKLLMALGIRRGQKIIEITYSDVASPDNQGEVIAKMNEKIDKAIKEKNILFIDEAYRFASDDWGRNAFEALIDKMEKNRNDFTVILAGYKERNEELYRINQGLKSRIKEIEFPDYTEEQIGEIVINMFESSHRYEKITTVVRERINKRISSLCRRGLCENGRGARKLFEEINEKVEKRGTTGKTYEVQLEDVPEPMTLQKDKALKFIDDFGKEFRGIPKVKAFLEELLFRCAQDEERINASRESLPANDLFNNCFFVGPPGTGKTSVAEKMSEYFNLLGLTPSRLGILKTGANDLASPYGGEYSRLVYNKFQEAKGRILFIDEAYSLAHDEQGRNILNEIVKNLTNPEFRDVILIMAGYEDDMNELYKINQGMRRRVPHKVHFENFTTDELVDIFFDYLGKESLYQVNPEQEGAIRRRLETLFVRMAAQRDFGNAGTVKEFVKKVCTSCYRREHADGNSTHIITIGDLEQEQKNTEKLEDIYEEMCKKLVGIDEFIKKIEAMRNEQRRKSIRAEILGYKEREESHNLYNMRLIGPSGVGKTEIGRYLGRIFTAMGLITHKQIREVRGQELTGEYLGQTKTKVLEAFDNAQDSLLFIDEAYGMCRGGRTDQYGREAVDTLVGCLTDKRNSSTIVVLAGYPAEMKEFMENNPGLARRFPNEFHISAFDTGKCVEVVMSVLKQNEYRFTEDCEKEFREKLERRFSMLMKLDSTGNADAAIRLANRIMDVHDNGISWDELEKCNRDKGIDDETRRKLAYLSVEDIPSFTQKEIIELILGKIGIKESLYAELETFLTAELPVDAESHVGQVYDLLNDIEWDSANFNNEFRSKLKDQIKKLWGK